MECGFAVRTDIPVVPQHFCAGVSQIGLIDAIDRVFSVDRVADMRTFAGVNGFAGKITGRFIAWANQNARVAAAVGCFVFAVSLDFIEGLESDHPWNAYTIIADNWDIEDFTRSSFDVKPFDALRHFSKSLEECTEMLGMSLFWYVFMSHLLATSPDLQIVKTDTGKPGDD